MTTIEDIIKNLNLSPHAEGGWFRQTYVSGGSIPETVLPAHRAARPFSTSILFLLTAENFSAFHRIASDEIWYHHEGDPVDIHIIDAQGSLECRTLGPASLGYSPQAAVEAGSWFASSLAPEGKWALTGCAVAPGFDYSDFELADRAALTAEFPSHGRTIAAYTRV